MGREWGSPGPFQRQMVCDGVNYLSGRRGEVGRGVCDRARGQPYPSEGNRLRQESENLHGTGTWGSSFDGDGFGGDVNHHGDVCGGYSRVGRPLGNGRRGYTPPPIDGGRGGEVAFLLYTFG